MTYSKLFSLAIVFLSIGLFSSCQEEEDAGFTIAPVKSLTKGYYLISDQDKDGIPDQKDNCPQTYNPKQEDRDNDGIGDACDRTPSSYDPTEPSTDEEDELDIEDCEEEECYRIPDYSFMMMMVRRPKPCDAGVCITDIRLAMVEESLFFNPEDKQFVQIVDPRSGKELEILSQPEFSQDFRSMQFAFPEEVSVSFDELQVIFRVNALIEQETVPLEFSATIYSEGVEFP